MRNKKVAIVGSGYSGIGLAFHLRKVAGVEVTVFDACKPGTGGASAVSAGMLHPLNAKGKMSWKGKKTLLLSCY